MEYGLGLPNAVAGADRGAVLDWAREAERAGFSSLATTDRLVYPSLDGLPVLAAAAAVTERISLITAVLIGPLRSNVALLAKEAATVDVLSGGRLSLGLAVGARPDDFAVSGVPTAGRGARLDAQLDELGRLWAGERRGMAGGVGPRPVRDGGPRLMLGGHSPAAVARVARRGTGWIGGSGGPGQFAAGAGAVRAAWQQAGREGRPRLSALLYFALGPDAADLAAGYLSGYYAMPPGFADRVLAASAVGAGRLAELAAEFEAAGCDELLLVPCSTDLKQLELLSAALPR